VRPIAAAVLFLLIAPRSHAAQDPSVDLESLMTTPVLLYNQGRQISQGTGFFYANVKADGGVDTVFLATNYHVVTGHAPRLLTQPAGDRVRIALHLDAGNLENFKWFELPLYNERKEPLWVSSTMYQDADIVLLPLPAQMVPLYVFTESNTRGDLKVRPTLGATLLGYPYGFFDTKHLLPIWKTGHIATEPDVDFEGDPTFLVDVSAYPGMSGSPVLAVATGIYESTDGTMRSGRVHKLLGIFSSMPVVRRSSPSAADRELSEVPSMRDTSLQLGYVWKAAVIVEAANRYHR